MTLREWSNRIAGLIAEAMAAQECTQKELCELLGISESSITKRRKEHRLHELDGGLTVRLANMAGYDDLDFVRRRK